MDIALLIDGLPKQSRNIRNNWRQYSRCCICLPFFCIIEVLALTVLPKLVLKPQPQPQYYEKATTAVSHTGRLFLPNTQFRQGYQKSVTDNQTEPALHGARMAMLHKTAFLFFAFFAGVTTRSVSVVWEHVSNENNSSPGTMQRRQNGKEITLGLHVILKKPSARQNLPGEGIKIFDPRTVEEYSFVSHAAMDSNEPSIPGLRNV